MSNLLLLVSYTKVLKFIYESFSSLKKKMSLTARSAPRNYWEQTEAIHTTTHKQRAQDRPAEAVVLSIIQEDSLLTESLSYYSI